MRAGPLLAVGLGLFVVGVAGVMAQRPGVFLESRDHAAIHYTSNEPRDPVAALNRRLRAGETSLRFDPVSGYLRSTLDALGLPLESQVAVFSQTSFQGDDITPTNPRVIYFGDSAAVAWVPGTDILEVAAVDPRQGVMFYSLAQREGATPQFRRDEQCLVCHLSWETLAVPGLQVLTTYPTLDANAFALGGTTDHRTPLAERWGGWYVTGEPGVAAHLGNGALPRASGAPRAPRLASLAARFDASRYPTPYSDVVALMVLEHQAHMTNLLVRTGWEGRVAGWDARDPVRSAQGAVNDRVRDAVRELVDYMLFVDEAPLGGPVTGSSGFVEAFARSGPADARGRSLRQFDLTRRLMRYPCSYMIYSDLFESLPDTVRDAVYARLWQVLSGREADSRYRRLTREDRQAVVEVLRATKPALPAYFAAAVS